MTQETDVKASKWIKPVLIVSLCLNLLVIAAVGSFLFAGNHKALRFSDAAPSGQRAMGPRGGDAISLILRSLDRKERRDLGKTIRGALNGVGKSDTMQDRQDLADILRADPFDADAFKAKLQSIQSTRNTRSQLVQDQVVELLSDMTVAQRTAFVERLVRNGKGRGQSKN